MGVLLNKIYDRYSAKDFLFLANKIKDIEWVVEAGVHDGTDTEILLNTFDVKLYLAFEPDPTAFAIAEAKLRNNKLKRNIKLIPVALSDRSQFNKIVSPNGFGLGISQISNDPSSQGVTIYSDLLDNYLGTMNNKGLLWLDVEGHSLNALNGSKANLTKFMICKIEVQTHAIDSTKIQDAFKIHKLMYKNFILIRAPLQPGYFGDLVYIRKDKISLNLWVFGKVITTLFFLLHKIIYPLLGKPK
jgi:FkbM family methyltransferase